MSRREQQKAAKEGLQGLKDVREGKVSRLDQLELDDEEDIYELVDEDKYAEIVENRRKAGDFVVDDDGLGYFDNGEEVLGVGEDTFDAKKRLQAMAKDSDNRVAKKARRLAEESSGPQRNTILKHLHAGVGGGGSSKPLMKEKAAQNLLDIDALLDDKKPKGVSSSTSSSTTTATGGANRPPMMSAFSTAPFRGSIPPNPAMTMMRPPNMAAMMNAVANASAGASTTMGSTRKPGVLPSFSLRLNANASSATSHHQQGGGEVKDMGGDMVDFDAAPHEDLDTMDMDGNSKNNESGTATTVVVKEEEQKEAEEILPKMSLTKTTKKLKTFEPPPSSLQKAAAAKDDSLKPLQDITATTEGIFGGQLLQQQQQDAPQAVLTSSTIDKKQWILSRPITTATTTEVAGSSTAAGAVGEASSEEYMRMYWLDAVELNGTLYLFGRIPVAPASGNTKGPMATVSGCVIVHNCERNLFVLPKVIPDQYTANGHAQQRHEMSEVAKELHSLLVPSIIPRQEGRAFKCKVVSRKYAFEHGDVPREETKYMKVVYSSKYGLPNPSQCAGNINLNSQGKASCIERIFGATSSALELFVLKRKLMGPCWIEIKKPRVINEAYSWCKLEAHVDNPKFVVKLVNNLPPPPPLVSMCLSIKTVVNLVTHTHEIVALSGVIHPKVDSEADSEVNPAILKRFTFIRQLGVTCGAGYPASFPHDIAQEQRKCADIALEKFPHESELLKAFFKKIEQEDPDIFASHNLLGFELDVILARAVANRCPQWSLLGKLRKSKPPKSVNDRDAISGRILCDTYKAAKEFLRETTYSLGYLASSQLKLPRQEIDPIDVPKYFTGAADIGHLARHTFWDAWLVQGLMFKLQVVPLTKQLTNLSGNLWSRTIRGARAERIEYLLLHEFHALKYVLPERKQSEFAASNATNGKKGGGGPNRLAMANDEMEEDMMLEDGGGGGGGGKGSGGKGVGGMSRKRAKAAYAGGLVLEPKKGLYDSYILLLDFNSLYPSIIQEYNLCFTTVAWTKYMPNESNTASTATLTAVTKAGGNKKASTGEEGIGADGAESDHGENSDDEEGKGGGAAGAANGEANNGAKALPPLPEPSAQPGVLPRVIKTLVDRRRQVKNLLKNEKDPGQRQQLDIRQKALKLTANSMYGCLGFSFSRFYARPIAALVTAMGREALQRTVDLATNTMSLDVIYGDTDSVMINTGFHDKNDLPQVKELGNKVKKEVNKLYKSLELDLDGIFRSMLLLKKKKYAALVVQEHGEGQPVTYEKEMKGLDLVRRDWCVLSKETGKYVVDQILSGEPCEEIVMKIHNHLHDLAIKIRNNGIEIDQFVITKGLNKNPKDYPDCNGQAHLQVALQMLKANKPVNIGDHIPYVICTQGATEGASAAHRAYHPDEVKRAPEQFTIDYEWYLSNQILPPIARLCEPIEGTSPAIISERLGLDASKYARSAGRHGGQGDDSLEDGWGFTPKCLMEDSERFKHCYPLTCVCEACYTVVPIQSIMELEADSASNSAALTCTSCGSMFFGKKNARDCYCYLSNRITLLVRDCLKKYYDGWLVCDDASCGRRTMQQSVRGLACTEDCHGRMVQEYDELALYNQLKYLESLFDVPRMQAKRNLDEMGLLQLIPKIHQEALRLLKEHMSNSVKASAYNWVRPSLWTTLFGKAVPPAASSSSSSAAAGGLVIRK